MAPVARLEKRRALDGPPGEDVHDAADRVVAPHARPPAVDDLDLLDRLERDPIPVHQAPERVVDRDTVEKQEGGGRGGGGDGGGGEVLGLGGKGEGGGGREEVEGGERGGGV